MSWNTYADFTEWFHENIISAETLLRMDYENGSAENMEMLSIQHIVYFLKTFHYIVFFEGEGHVRRPKKKEYQNIEVASFYVALTQFRLTQSRKKDPPKQKMVLYPIVKRPKKQVVLKPKKRQERQERQKRQKRQKRDPHMTEKITLCYYEGQVKRRENTHESESENESSEGEYDIVFTDIASMTSK